MTDDRRPIHLAVLIGVSAGAYAATLAGVTGLQAASDAHVRAQRAPIDLASAISADDHAELESAIEAAARRYAVLADRYRRAGIDLEGMDCCIDNPPCPPSACVIWTGPQRIAVRLGHSVRSDLTVVCDQVP